MFKSLFVPTSKPNEVKIDWEALGIPELLEPASTVCPTCGCELSDADTLPCRDIPCPLTV